MPACLLACSAAMTAPARPPETSLHRYHAAMTLSERPCGQWPGRREEIFGSGADLVTAYASSDHDASSDHGSGRGNGSQSYHFHGHFFDQDGVRGDAVTRAATEPDFPSGEFTLAAFACSTTQNRRGEAKETCVDSIVITAAAMVAGQVLALLGLWLRLRSQLQQEDVHHRLLIDVLGLLGLWLRLRSQIRREHAHGRLLVDVVRALPGGGQVHEQRADGASLTLTVAPEPGTQGGSSG